MGLAVEPLLREAPVMNEGSWVGLDVHARSVVAGVIDVRSGEVRSLRVPPGCDATVAWLTTLPAPVRVAYEAGPTGDRLARACAGAGGRFVLAERAPCRPAPRRHTRGGARARKGGRARAGRARAGGPATAAAAPPRPPPFLSVPVERRREGKPPALRARADRSARRLHRRWHAL